MVILNPIKPRINCEVTEQRIGSLTFIKVTETECKELNSLLDKGYCCLTEFSTSNNSEDAGLHFSDLIKLFRSDVGLMNSLCIDLVLMIPFNKSRAALSRGFKMEYQFDGFCLMSINIKDYLNYENNEYESKEFITDSGYTINLSDIHRIHTSRLSKEELDNFNLNCPNTKSIRYIPSGLEEEVTYKINSSSLGCKRVILFDNPNTETMLLEMLGWTVLGISPSLNRVILEYKTN